MNKLKESIINRHSVRAYSDKYIEDDEYPYTKKRKVNKEIHKNTMMNNDFINKEQPIWLLFLFQLYIIFLQSYTSTKGDYYENNGRDATEYFK